MSHSEKTKKSKWIYGLLILLICAEWLVCIGFKPIYLHIQNGVQVPATVIGPGQYSWETQVSYQYDGKTYECLLDDHSEFNIYTPKENDVVDLYINSQAPDRIIPHPFTVVLQWIKPLKIFILFISVVILFAVRNKSKGKIESRNIEVDRAYLTDYFMKRELLSILLITTVAMVNIIPLLDWSSFLVPYILIIFICLYNIGKSTYHIIRLIKDDHYLTVQKTSFLENHFDPGAGEEYGTYVITTKDGEFAVPKKLTCLNPGDTVLLVSYPDDQAYRLLLALTHKATCDIVSDSAKNENNTPKKRRFLLTAVLFLIAAFGVGELMDHYKKTHPTYVYDQQIVSRDKTTISDPKKDPADPVNTKQEFTVDLTARGEVAEDAAEITEKTVIINGHSYTLPVHYSDLIDNGWNLPEGYTFVNRYQPNTTTQLVGFFLEDGNGGKLLIGQAKNPTDEEVGLENCLIGSLSCNNVNTVDFVLPGGITANSTAADVIEIFGNPEDSEHFAWVSFDEDTLIYHENVASGVSFYFNFESNGRIKSFSVTDESLRTDSQSPMSFFREIQPVIMDPHSLSK